MAVHSADRPPVAALPDERVREVSTRATYALAAGCLAALTTACLLSPHEATHGPVVCPFRLATGLPCPGCGMTRAWVFLMHGDLGSAVSANPFAFVAVPFALFIVLSVAVAGIRRRPLPDLGRVVRSKLAMALVAAWILFGVVRAVAVLTGSASI